MRDFVFTSSSVLPGHPDKLCDRISDAIVDACLTRDPKARVTAECAIASDVIFLVCHSSSVEVIDHTTVVRDVVREVGYSAPILDPDRVAIMVSLGAIEPEEAGDGHESDGGRLSLTASNNATIFGYACRQTSDLMPAPIKLAHGLARAVWRESLRDGAGGLGPDGQVQVTLEYRDRKPVRLAGLSVLAGAPRESRRTDQAMLELVLEEARSLGIVSLEGAGPVQINPRTAFIGGPRWHPGLTGRKIAVDTYGDFSRQTSSALSGKDARRIDRIGAYAARYAAKNIVAAGLSDECEVQLSYTAGLREPVSIGVDTMGTGCAPEEAILEALTSAMDFRPGAIIRSFDLDNLPARSGGVFYRELSAFGQMGEREFDIPWERTDLAAALARDLKI